MNKLYLGELTVGGKTLLTQVDVPLENGLVFLTGPNGCGKTSLLKEIKRLLDKPIGKISKLLNYKETSNCLFISTSETLLPKVYPHEFLQYLIKDKQIVDNLIDYFRITNDVYLDELSDGNKMKVIIASLYSSKQDILLLDEPFNYMDNESVYRTYLFLCSLAMTKTIICSTHPIDIIFKEHSKFWQIKDKVIHILAESPEENDFKIVAREEFSQLF